MSTSSSTATRTTRRGRRGGRRASKSSNADTLQPRATDSSSSIEFESENEIQPEHKVEQWLNKVEEEDNIEEFLDWADEPCPADCRPDSPHPHRSPMSSISSLDSSSTSSSSPQKRTRRGSLRTLSFAEKARTKSRNQIEQEYRAEQMRMERERQESHKPKLIVTAKGGRKWC